MSLSPGYIFSTAFLTLQPLLRRLRAQTTLTYRFPTLGKQPLMFSLQYMAGLFY